MSRTTWRLIKHNYHFKRNSALRTYTTILCMVIAPRRPYVSYKQPFPGNDSIFTEQTTVPALLFLALCFINNILRFIYRHWLAHSITRRPCEAGLELLSCITSSFLCVLRRSFLYFCGHSFNIPTSPASPDRGTSIDSRIL